jgi:iron complex outermembrane receptor protein
VLGLWQNDSEGRPDSYLRSSTGQPVYSGPVTINGRIHTLGQTDFNVSNEDLRHVMHGISSKSNTKGVFDWEVAGSLYDYSEDLLRAATVALPGGAGRIVDGSGTGWNTFSAKGVWRPPGRRHLTGS